VGGVVSLGVGFLKVPPRPRTQHYSVRARIIADLTAIVENDVSLGTATPDSSLMQFREYC
jgi:hypothetical protein